MSEPELHPPPIPGRPGLSLALLAGITLFMELAFIRWASASVIYLGYFSNFVLMACFLGIGLGFLTSRRKFDLLPWALPVLALVCFTIYVLQTSITLSPDGIEGRVYFNTGAVLSSPAPAWVTLPVLFVGIAATCMFISQATGRMFPHFHPIKAYTWDIAGSLAGIVAFTVLSFLWTPAWVWFAIVGVVLVFLNWQQPRQKRLFGVVATVMATGVVFFSDVEDGAHELVWSPYQQLQLQYSEEAKYGFIRANRVPHQELSSEELVEVGRDIPWDLAKQAGIEIEDVLIIGAGSGTDVSEALVRPVKTVTAVEIDPAIAQMGRKWHPDKPYDDPRVELVVNDGRAFLERTDRKWDMIVYALPDSLALYSSYSSIRLESFLFTRESLQLARNHLTEGGMLVLYNDYRTDTVVAKLSTLLEEAFGVPPVYRTAQRDVVKIQLLMASTSLEGVESEATFDSVDESLLPHDDWPFLYMNSRTVPKVYWFLILGILFATFLAVWLLAPRGALKSVQWPFFFMGAAFLLLETKSIIQFSLLFGTTWLVNSLVFGGVLVMVLLANLLVWKFEIRRMWPWYILLAVVLVANFLVPVSSLHGLDDVARYVAATALLLAPIFVANIIFSGTFASSEESDASFGWNILGTMVGGTVENFSLVLGYHYLAVIVAVFYALAFATDRIRRSKKTAGP